MKLQGKVNKTDSFSDELSENLRFLERMNLYASKVS